MDSSEDGAPLDMPALVQTHSMKFGNNVRNTNAANLLRTVVGDRKQDYVTDAAHNYSSVRSMRSNPRDSQQSNNNNATAVEQHNTQPTASSKWNSWVQRASHARKQFLWRLLNTQVWKCALICFTIILLFGSQVRDLILEKTADMVFDIIFLVTFVFFWIDITVRMDAEPNYFQLYIFSYIGYSSGEASANQTSAANQGGALEAPLSAKGAIGRIHGCCGKQTLPFHVGSFLFWCDVISTIVLLREISYVHVSNIFEEQEINIDLDSRGMLGDIAGKANVNQRSPIEFSELELLAIIGKSLRAARFIRSSAAVKWTFRMNSFFIVHVVNLFRRFAAARKKVRRGDDGQLDAGALIVGKASWSNVVVASTARSLSMLSLKEERRKKGCMAGFMEKVQNMGFRRGDKEHLRRHMAAIKIQRAWRNRKRHHDSGYDSHGENDFAWGRGPATYSMEKVLKKRSVMQITVPDDTTKAKVALSNQPVHSQSQQGSRKRGSESQVGSAMRELTGQRVAIGIIVALVITVLLTYKENDAIRPSTMIVLHGQTMVGKFVNKALQAARDSTIPDLYSYTLANGTTIPFDDLDELLPREKLFVIVRDTKGQATTGCFSNQLEIRQQAIVSILSTIFVLLVWFFGVTSFAGPVMILVVIPIERMVRLLGMLMLDPLGYQSTSRYKRFVAEEDEIIKNTHWTKEVLKGMETSFLMSTITRIGSLMKVGFGSAGVEIIRNNLQKDQTKNMLMLSSQGTTVSCIFLFCDIRQFTDATECLQEEVFVFTNRIAAVVHSICHSYGGSANKNIGDAFLLSWILDEEVATGGNKSFFGGNSGSKLIAKHNQADKALYSVVEICKALHHDDYYVETMSQVARDRLKAKLSKRKGPIVQMGLGLHAGKAVQGAIGSTRKIDATYVSEAVERVEFLESSTKTYGLQVLMSNDFHHLLNPSNRRRCRKVDQIIIRSDDDDEEETDDLPAGDKVELFTFDMDIDALWRETKQRGMDKHNAWRESDSDIGSERGTKREFMRSRQGPNGLMKVGRRLSILGMDLGASVGGAGAGAGAGAGVPDDNANDGGNQGLNTQSDNADGDIAGSRRKRELPTRPAFYSANVWVEEPMRKMRQRYADGLFFQEYNAGLHSFYNKDWDRAKQCFVNILDRFEDGPSRHFLNIINEHKGRPPRGFLPYSIA